MKKQYQIIILEFEQPNGAVWKEIQEYVSSWNKNSDNKFLEDEPSELVIYFDDKDDKQLKDLEYYLDSKHEERGWEWIKSETNNPKKEDIEEFDFIQIIGDGYPDEFFLNESTALSPEIPCVTCGTIDSHLRNQILPLQIDERFLTKKGEPNDHYQPSGLDLINMPHGALLVSDKTTDLLKQHKNFTGYSLLEVKDRSGKTSSKLFQLTVDTILLTPDKLEEPGTICPACGTVLGTMISVFAISKERLNGAACFARSPNGLSSIYISKALYNLLKTANTRGLAPVQGAKLT
jgi:hypothetical protein